MERLLHAAVMAASFALSGCFFSDQPLISAEASDKLFGADAAFTVTQWNGQSNGWDATGNRDRIYWNGNAYVHEIKNPITGAPEQEFLRFKRLPGSPNWLVVQQGVQGTAVYGFASVEGDTVFQYPARCDDGNGQPLGFLQPHIDSGTLIVQDGASCTLNDQSTLLAIAHSYVGFASLLGHPTAKYEFSPGTIR